MQTDLHSWCCKKENFEFPSILICPENERTWLKQAMVQLPKSVEHFWVFSEHFSGQERCTVKHRVQQATWCKQSDTVVMHTVLCCVSQAVLYKSHCTRVVYTVQGLYKVQCWAAESRVRVKAKQEKAADGCDFASWQRLPPIICSPPYHSLSLSLSAAPYHNSFTFLHCAFSNGIISLPIVISCIHNCLDIWSVNSLQVLLQLKLLFFLLATLVALDSTLVSR